MADQSAKSFLSLLERSGIVVEQRLKSALKELAVKQSENSLGQKVSVDTLANHLVDSGLITDWHVDKLRKGKYKGFYLGKFKLLGHLGTGGMSSVYLAEHKISEKKRAIKVLPRKRVSDKSYLDRFYLEGRAAAALNHPNVVRIYDICNDSDTHYMVMEYVKGSDLYETVKDSGPLDFRDAAEYIVQAAYGLTHAHERGLVHRDIKPANLLLTDDGVVKILDLGLALLKEEETESLTVLYNEKVMGTADYLSPEQAINSHEVDHRADIYSLGCTLYYLLTAKPPFSEGTLAQRIAKHQTAEPPSIREVRPDCPDTLIEICHRMMRKDPADRYADCDQLAAVMKNFAANCISTEGTSKNLHAAMVAEAAIVGANATAVVAGAEPSIPMATPVSPGGGGGERPSNADSRTEEIKSSETVSNEAGDNPARSPFAIETSAVPDSPKASVSSKILTHAKQPATAAAVAPKIRVRRRKKPPVWLAPTIIGGMLLLLIGVLLLVTRTL